MLIRNVRYTTVPPPYEIRRAGEKATVLFPCEVIPDIVDDRTEYIAKKVYYTETGYTTTLDQRVSTHFEAWLEKAKNDIRDEDVTMQDVMDALNALTDIVLGGGI